MLSVSNSLISARSVHHVDLCLEPRALLVLQSRSHQHLLLFFFGNQWLSVTVILLGEVGIRLGTLLQHIRILSGQAASQKTNKPPNFINRLSVICGGKSAFKGVRRCAL